MAEATLPPSFNVMVKPRGPICNLRCDYCYYLAKEELYPDGAFRMTDELLEEFTRQYIAAQQVPEVTFGWQGGEPTLMGLAFFERAVALQHRYARPGMRILNALQTNGTLLDEAWCRFLRQQGFLVGLSLDGPRELHDAFRHDRASQPTFDRVMRGLRLLQEHGVEYNILATVHAANAGHPLEVYRFLRDEAGARFIQFIPIVERQGDGLSPRSVGSRAYGEFLIGVFDEWLRRDVGTVFVQVFDVCLAAWLGVRPGLCVFEETCGLALVMEHNGDLYACDHFVDPAHRLGNILETPLRDLVASEAQRRFGLAKREALPRLCRECPVGFVCHGGCPKDRLLRTPEGEPGLSYLCEGYRAFFGHIDGPMRLMAAEVRAGRPAASVMLRLQQEASEQQRRFAGARRNDPCPCGSGLKFKHCHGARGRGT